MRATSWIVGLLVRTKIRTLPSTNALDIKHGTHSLSLSPLSSSPHRLQHLVSPTLSFYTTRYSSVDHPTAPRPFSSKSLDTCPSSFDVTAPFHPPTQRRHAPPPLTAWARSQIQGAHRTPPQAWVPAPARALAEAANAQGSRARPGDGGRRGKGFHRAPGAAPEGRPRRPSPQVLSCCCCCLSCIGRGIGPRPKTGSPAKGSPAAAGSSGGGSGWPAAAPGPRS